MDGVAAETGAAEEGVVREAAGLAAGAGRADGVAVAWKVVELDWGSPG
jgi:hypothetical protein